MRIRFERQHGFSLIELAVVLVIIGLLLGGGLAAFTATTEQARRAEQKRQLQHIREALYGFAMVEGRLPCPDDLDDATAPDPDGTEDRSGSPAACDTDVGALPWVTLGLGRRDAWNNPLIYQVEPDYADDDPAPGDDASSFAFSDSATITVVDGNGDTIVNGTPAVVVSAGPQGEQIWVGGALKCPGASGAAANGFSDDETENCNGDDNYVESAYRGADAATGRFDDMLIWVPDHVLKARMVDAGRLP